MYSTHTSLFLRSKNATALAGAEVFTSLFCKAKCDCSCRSRGIYLFSVHNSNKNSLVSGDYVILTGGSTFSTIISKNGESSTLAAPHVEVVDTVGAGDSFSGTFTARTLLGDTLAEAHRKAVNTAAYVCTANGAWPEYPDTMPDYLAQAAQ